MEIVGYLESDTDIKLRIQHNPSCHPMTRTPLKIAVLEDHDELREVLVQELKDAGYLVSGADCAAAIDELIVTESFDLIILDVNLPGEDGLSVARRLRNGHPELFIIMVSVRDAHDDRVAGYANGADIYLPKPISLEELTAAISSIHRRLEATNGSAHALCLDVTVSLLQMAEQHVVLNEHELILMRALATAFERRLPYYRLLELVGKDVSAPSKAWLEVAVGRLRTKMAKIGVNGPAIKPIRGEGYQLMVPIRCTK